MKTIWLLVYLSSSYGGAMSHIETASRVECEKLRAAIIAPQDWHARQRYEERLTCQPVQVLK